MVRAVDPALRRDAYGAEIRIRAGKRHWWRLLNPASGFLSSGDPRVHFGLGPVRKVDEIEIIWPDGAVETFAGCNADQVINLAKGRGKRK